MDIVEAVNKLKQYHQEGRRVVDVNEAVKVVEELLMWLTSTRFKARCEMCGESTLTRIPVHIFDSRVSRDENSGGSAFATGEGTL